MGIDVSEYLAERFPSPLNNFLAFFKNYQTAVKLSIFINVSAELQ